MPRPTPPMEPKPKLDATTLYEGDNGRIFCGALACAGSAAHFTGRTIAGQRVRRIDARYVAAWPVSELGPVRCASCGRTYEA